MGEDLYESFVNYQRRLIGELDLLASEYNFETLNATLPVDEIADDLETRVSRLMATREIAMDGNPSS